ncbi:YMGG-like glycine zipper-containing protein [Aporhodopirellula aestuarii]|uniref:Glycine zipper domain-containing protein n=1 Tax=Aporhodopirellula aestuarii TaxID=2950107 RepID=A0ABT0TXD0_9BACT|nr:glycine zipper domain-containing protein [Aporhodopirellula aestuarii]MCM2369131.1 glycine zipper domain-containing protein [Aporhodopirellula aestuarii]
MFTKTDRMLTVCSSMTMISLCMLSGCQTTSHAHQDAAVGTFLGTATGAIIGHQSGHAGEGALIGAATGAVAGALIGDAKDARDERDAALRQASYPGPEPALTNNDLIRMAQSGLGDHVIINTVQTRGGIFDLTPDGLILLKSNGVSDAVIVAVQNASKPHQYVDQSVASPSVVYVNPRPAVRVVTPIYRAPVRRGRPGGAAFHFRF